jgi:microcompartment protein CcmL/EutN
MTDEAIGMIEAHGLVSLCAGLEAMTKAAAVECVLLRRVSSGYVVTAIRGDLASVQEAIDAGTETISQRGEVRSVRVYPSPHPAAVALLQGAGGWVAGTAPSVEGGG